MPERPDYYAILEVDRDAGRQTIEEAYDRLARLYQPDPERPPLHPEKLALLDEAFDTLDDPGRRAEYDRLRGDAPVQKPRRYMGRVLVASTAVFAVAVAAAALLITVTEWSPPIFRVDVEHEVRILSPRQNDVLTSPVTLTVESTGITIADPEAGIDGAAHYHAFINIHPFTPINQVIPHEPGIIHFTEESITLDLDPGAYTIIVVLGDNDHVRLPNASVHFVDFWIVE